MDNNHKPTANAEANTQGDYEAKRFTKEGWGWTIILDNLWRQMESVVGSDHFTTKQGAVLRTRITELAEEIHDYAEVAFLMGTRRDDYHEFSQGKHGQQLKRGIITLPEYWQEFARFCADRQVI